MSSFLGARAAPAPTPPAYRGPPEASLYIFSAIIAGLIALVALQRPARGSPRWLPAQGAKRAYEVWVLRYSAVWMGIFGSVVVTELYEKFDAAGYFLLCGGLALPLIVQPFVHGRSAGVWHAGRAQLWIAIFGFIGNYWYTHYFYVVLRARYTMPAWRLNDVPIAMYLATHFYFSTYHVLANLALRRVRSSYAAGPARTALQAALVLAMSYAMAFMETLTISNFPYYDFEARWLAPPLRRPATTTRTPAPRRHRPPLPPPSQDRHLAYTVGSAFYGLYFVVSFPVYFALDEPNVGPPNPGAAMSDVAVSALGAGMLVLLLLDAVRATSRRISRRVPRRGDARDRTLRCSARRPRRHPGFTPARPRRHLCASTWQVRLVIGVPLQISGKLYEITG